jgi:hypothetical protein
MSKFIDSYNSALTEKVLGIWQGNEIAAAEKFNTINKFLLENQVALYDAVNSAMTQNKTLLENTIAANDKILQDNVDALKTQIDAAMLANKKILEDAIAANAASDLANKQALEQALNTAKLEIEQKFATLMGNATNTDLDTIKELADRITAISQVPEY